MGKIRKRGAKGDVSSVSCRSHPRSHVHIALKDSAIRIRGRLEERWNNGSSNVGVSRVAAAKHTSCVLGHSFGGEVRMCQK